MQFTVLQQLLNADCIAIEFKWWAFDEATVIKSFVTLCVLLVLSGENVTVEG